MLKQRVITALLLLPLVAFILFGLELKYFAAALIVVNYIMAWEWARLSGVQDHLFQSVFALVVAFVSLLIWYLAPGLEFWPAPSWFLYWHWDSSLIVFWAAVLTWFVAFAFILFSPKSNVLWDKAPWVRLFMGLILINGFWVSIVGLRSSGILVDVYRGAFFVLFMLTIIWGADVGGYLFGKLFGKRKLAPSVSPGKTWEGFMGGVALSLAVAFTGAYLLNLNIQNTVLFILAIVVISIISVAGDLFESLLKRQVNLKDSSQLLPGHGGILDRLDSTIAVTPFFLFIATALEWL